MNSTAFVLFLVFLILKLCNVIAWSWWWVTAPLWIGWTLSLIVFFVAGAFVTKVLKKQKTLLRDWPKAGRKGW